MAAEPTGPVYVCLDAALQEDPLPKGVTLPTDLRRWIQQAPVQADPDGSDGRPRGGFRRAAGR